MPPIDNTVKRLYPRLRGVAHRTMGLHPGDGHQQPTEVLHQAYIRARELDESRFANDRAFLGYMATVMKNLLVDAARKQQRVDEKMPRVAFPVEVLESKAPWSAGWLLDLSQALDRMEQQDPHLHEVVILRVFLDLRMKEIADQLDRPLRTVELHWKLAKQWLTLFSP